MRTRVSTYGVAIRDGHILMTQLAEYCTRGGSWTFPGGGIDHGEQPQEALIREMFEETGLRVLDHTLFDAKSYSESARGPYLAVQLLYRVTVEGEARVMEEGGTTADVAWIPLNQIDALSLVPFVSEVLRDLISKETVG